MVLFKGEPHKYSVESLEEQIAQLKGYIHLSPDNKERLTGLEEAQVTISSDLSHLTLLEQGCMSLWRLCMTQRHGQGMTFGFLIHSELWNTMSKLGIRDDVAKVIFNIILTIDDIFREFQEKKEKQDQAKEKAKASSKKKKEGVK